MLPEQVSGLILKHLVLFDSDNPFQTRFDNIVNEHMAKHRNKINYNSSGAYVDEFGYVCEDVVSFVGYRATELVKIMRDVIIKSDVDYNSDLDKDLKSIFKSTFTGYQEMVIRSLETLGVEMKAGASFVNKPKKGLDLIPYKINTAIELFCQEYKTMKKKHHNTPTSQTIFNAAVTNAIVGNDNTINITSTITSLEQTINQSDLPTEKKEQAKGLLGLLSKVVTAGVEPLTSGAVKAVLDKFIPTL